MQGEARFAELQKIKLKLPDKKLQKALGKKIKGYGEARAIYQEVFNFGRPDWTLASLYRLGTLFHDFSKEIRNSPVPRGLTESQIELYKGGLEEKASDIELGAIEAYTQCLDAALKTGWFNQYSKKSEVALAELKPREYRKPSEKRADPVFYRDGFTGAPFTDKAVKETESGLGAGADDEGSTGNSETGAK
jgi:hypothetical protein